MKKWLILFLSAILVLSLCACASSEQSGAERFAIDFENGTVFDGTYTYHFTFSGNKEAYSVHITFPDESTYYWNTSGGLGHGGWSDDYVEGRYMSGDALCALIASKAPDAKDPAKPAEVIFGLLAIASGAFSLANPRAAWYWSYGWRYRNAEPSDLALEAGRVGGAIAIVVGVLLLFF